MFSVSPWRLVDGVSHQECQLVRVLAYGWDSDGARPVEVEVAQLVGEHLEVVGLQPGLVVDDVVGGRVHGALE